MDIMKFCLTLLLVVGVAKTIESTRVYKREARSTNRSAVCQNVFRKAQARTEYIETPGYPDPFPGDVHCTWIIHSEAGKRIRLEFQKFFLLEPVDGTCYYQYVSVKSPFSQLSMGPYCGLVGLPTIISTGNLIYVELQTPVPVTTDNYEGFRLAFQETTESSSYELRPDNTGDDVIFTASPELLDEVSPTPAPVITTTLRGTKSTTKSSRFRPSRRPLIRQPRPPPMRTNHDVAPPHAIRPPLSDWNSGSQNNYYGSNRRPPLGKGHVIHGSDQKEEPALKIEFIVGITVGGVVGLALVTLIILKTCTAYSKKDEAIRNAGNVANSNKGLTKKTWFELHGKAGANKPSELPMQPYYPAPPEEQSPGYYDTQYAVDPYYYYYCYDNKNAEEQEIVQKPSTTSKKEGNKASTLPGMYAEPSHARNGASSKSATWNAIAKGRSRQEKHGPRSKTNNHRRIKR